MSEYDLLRLTSMMFIVGAWLQFRDTFVFYGMVVISVLLSTIAQFLK